MTSNGSLHGLMIVMATLAKSLRSSGMSFLDFRGTISCQPPPWLPVSRNAMMTYGDLFTGLGKAMDPELEAAVPVLLSKLVDVSGFLVRLRWEMVCCGIVSRACIACPSCLPGRWC